MGTPSQVGFCSPPFQEGQGRANLYSGEVQAWPPSGCHVNSWVVLSSSRALELLMADDVRNLGLPIPELSGLGSTTPVPMLYRTEPDGGLGEEYWGVDP